MDIVDSENALKMTSEDIEEILLQSSAVSNLISTSSVYRPWNKDVITTCPSTKAVLSLDGYVSKDRVETVILSEFCLEMCPYSSIKDCQNNSKICLKKNIMNKLDVC